MSVKSFTGGRFAFGVAGEFAGYIRKVSGGFIKANRIVHDLGTTNVQRKNPGLIEFEPLSFELAMGMGKPVWDWILASWNKQVMQKTCELQMCDFNHEIRAVRVFEDAFILKVTFPALDAGSSEPGYFTVEIDPQMIRYEKGTGQRIQAQENVAAKKWLVSNFRLELGDLPCSRVAKVESFSWEQKNVSARSGGIKMPSVTPAALNIPNLKLSISMADAPAWAAWHQSFVVEGHCTEANELDGSLTLLAPDMNEELAVMTLKQVGMLKMEQQALEANDEKIARFDVELYVEEMEFTLL